MAIAILLMLLQFVIMHYVVFAVFATDTLRGTWSRDDILNISRCIHFDIFCELFKLCLIHVGLISALIPVLVCLFPQDKFKNSTDVRVCTKRQQFIYYMPKLEQMFVLACIASCMLITSLIETTIYLFAEYEKSADTKIKYLPSKSGKKCSASNIQNAQIMRCILLLLTISYRQTIVANGAHSRHCAVYNWRHSVLHCFLPGRLVTVEIDRSVFHHSGVVDGRAISLLCNMRVHRVARSNDPLCTVSHDTREHGVEKKF